MLLGTLQLTNQLQSLEFVLFLVQQYQLEEAHHHSTQLLEPTNEPTMAGKQDSGLVLLPRIKLGRDSAAQCLQSSPLGSSLSGTSSVVSGTWSLFVCQFYGLHARHHILPESSHVSYRTTRGKACHGARFAAEPAWAMP